MMAVTFEKPTPKLRSFLIWAVVGAIFDLAVVLAVTALREAGDLSARVGAGPDAAKLGLSMIFTAVVVGLAMWNVPARPRSVSTFTAAAIGAAAIGYLGIKMGARLGDAGTFGAIGPSELVAASIGLFYALLAIVIGVGLASPRFGARFLNVEDVEELRDQRRMLAYASAGMAAMGVFLVLLALAGPGGVIPPFIALLGALLLLVAVGFFTFFQWRHMDELARNLSRECSAMTCYLIMAAGGGWAMLAHLGFVPAPAPLDWLSMFYGLVLVAAYIASGRRGLLEPR